MMKGRVSSTWIIFSCCFAIFAVCQLFPSFPITRTTPLSDFRSCSIKGNASTSQGIICDRKHAAYDFCMVNGPTFMTPINSTISLMAKANQHHQGHKIRPYPRKWQTDFMSTIKEFSLSVTSPESSHRCQVRHNMPAIVFSNSKYTGNFYHAIADNFVPLFVTARTMFGPNETILAIANIWPGWFTRYAQLLSQFTNYPIINLDTDDRVHCFPSVAVGLIAHGDITINSALMPNSESLRDFHALVHRSFHNHNSKLQFDREKNPRPKLVLLIRTASRVFVNQDQLVKVAEQVGFQVQIFEPTDDMTLMSAYELVSKSHAFVGVHGAGLTHLFFMRAGAVLIQVVPLGLDWASRVYHGGPALEIGLEYMEYKINVEESTLAERFGRDDEVLKDPESFGKKGWNNTLVYLKQQNVRLDLVRFTSYLKVAYDKAKKLMVTDNKFA